MNANRVARYRRQLEDLRARLRTDAASVVKQALSASGGQAVGSSNAPFHLGDAASEEFSQDMNAALGENETFLVQEVHDAIDRISTGNFGQCEECHAPIGQRRLDAMPYVRYCINCAETNHEGLDVNINSGRPRTPADTLAPEGSMQEDWRTADRLPDGAGRPHVRAVDEYAAGEPGGGSAVGGLAGSNVGHGEPVVSDLQDAAGSSAFDQEEARDDLLDSARSDGPGAAADEAPARKRTK